MMRPTIGERVEVDLFGLRITSDMPAVGSASGTIVALTPGAITVRLVDRHAEVIAAVAAVAHAAGRIGGAVAHLDLAVGREQHRRRGPREVALAPERQTEAAVHQVVERTARPAHREGAALVAQPAVGA